MTPEEQQQLYMAAFQYANKLQNEKLESVGVWYKVLRSQLTNEQLKKLEGDKDQVLQNRKRSEQLKKLLSLQRKLGLNAVQREKVLKWLALEKNANLDFVAICKSAITAEELANVFTPKQLKVLQEPFAQPIVVMPTGIDQF
jgi:hypothetical protein